jgi:hypothetical protein
MYSEEEIKAAIARVEKAKQNHPTGWDFLNYLGLDPTDNCVFSAFENSREHARRLNLEKDPVVLYTSAWLNGLALGIELVKGEKSDSIR